VQDRPADTQPPKHSLFRMMPYDSLSIERGPPVTTSMNLNWTVHNSGGYAQTVHYYHPWGNRLIVFQFLKIYHALISGYRHIYFSKASEFLIHAN
jgi:hypothetical protein